MAVAPRFYLDTNVVIAVVEGLNDLTDAQRDFLRRLDLGHAQAITSELTISECLVKPLRERRVEAVNAYLWFLDNRPELPVLPITRDLLIDAAGLRGNARMTLPDAVHVATARKSACDVLLTNDEGIKASSELQVLRWSTLDLRT